MHLTLLNGTKKPRGDENTNSTGILLDCGGKRAFLAGDINNIWGDETRLARKIGRVDLLKAGHHGFEGSNTIGYLAKLRPATVIFCNTNEWIFPTVRCRAACVSNSALLSTDDFPVGIAAVFGKDSLEYYSISGFQKPELSSPLTASKNKQD
jgi:beta-lactamase superfamily II metal-dependent hydrolase